MTRPALVRSLAVIGVASLTLAACSSSNNASSPSNSASAGAPGPLIIQTVLPQTGSLAFLGPLEFAGVKLAIQQINAAGGVLGSPVTELVGDSGDASTNTASTTADAGLAKNATVFIGAASSSVTRAIYKKITGAGAVQISPANTAIDLSSINDNGLYFRTAPPDVFQGAVLGGVASKDGRKNVAVLALSDIYGDGLGKAFSDNFTANGGKIAGGKVISYDPKASDFSAEVGQVKATGPDAIVLIGFDESKKILQEMLKQGVGPNKVPLYLVDGNLSNTIADGLPVGIMKGTKGTTPGAQSTGDFKAQMLTVDPALKDFSYGPESYDATILAALAAQAANSSAGKDIAANLAAVSQGGEACNSFQQCSDLLKAGKDIDYNGQSGPIDFNAVGDPAAATMGVYEYGADNKYVPLSYISGVVPPVPSVAPTS